ncbi:MAG: penicillin-binding protein 2 [Actinobacteria bacterium]|nr:penicillin-binding protein 2 [Actinomycetota bacterium]
MTQRLANRRVRLLLAIFTLAFGVMLARAVWLQAVRAHALGTRAASQHREVVVVPAGRGTIVDRTGVQLAIGEEVTTVYANPRHVLRPRAVALAAGKVLGLDPGTLYPLLADRSRGFVYLQRKADPARAAELRRRGFEGVGFYPEERRTYPQRTVAAQVLGFAGLDNKGLAGLELGLDRTLAGRPGRQTVVKDALGRVIDVRGIQAERPGRDVVLTLDHTVQANAEAVLRATVRRWHARSATAVVLDPRTGGVLAMAVAPGFDANRYPATRSALHRNRAVTDTFEPGSTYKVVTVGAVLTEKLVSPSTTYTLPDSIQVADRVVHDAEERETETMSVAQILSRSSNVGAVTLAQLLGKERLARWVARFGFGRETGVDFPGESAGIVLPPDRWSGSTIGNVPIGQGIAVTPIQLAAAYATIANRGVWTRPHLVERTAGLPRRRPERRRVLPGVVAAQLNTMLRLVVTEGTGTLAAVPGYTVAGKTGTAAKPEPEGGYSESRYVASFVGFVPATKPRLVILVTVDEPRGTIWGGVVAAPAFAEIARFDLQYLEVQPDSPSAPAE